MNWIQPGPMLCAAALSLAVSAAPADERDETAPEPPALADQRAEEVRPAGEARPVEGNGAPADDGEPDAPQVRRFPDGEPRTIEEHGQTITEYSRGGRVYMMTVKPRLGPTQYWQDREGDGQFQRHNSDDIDESVNLPKWRLGGW